jgi:hypothetical protein
LVLEYIHNCPTVQTLLHWRPSQHLSFISWLNNQSDEMDTYLVFENSMQSSADHMPNIELDWNLTNRFAYRLDKYEQYDRMCRQLIWVHVFGTVFSLPSRSTMWLDSRKYLKHTGVYVYVTGSFTLRVHWCSSIAETRRWMMIVFRRLIELEKDKKYNYTTHYRWW